MLKHVRRYILTFCFLSTLTLWFLFQNYVLLYFFESKVEIIKFLSWSPGDSPVFIFFGSLSNLHTIHFGKNFFLILIVGYILEKTLDRKYYISFLTLSLILVFPLFYISSIVTGPNARFIGTSGIGSILIGYSFVLSLNELISEGISERVEYIIFAVSAFCYLIFEIYLFYIQGATSSLVHSLGILFGITVFIYYYSIKKGDYSSLLSR